jgi:transcription-repair coupling factor (superfamily II helicase)
MRDLEIRGAGNLLGVQQSGHIAAVGYEHYCQLLEAAVRRLKQLPPKFSVDVEIDLPGSAYLPDEYVSDIRLKIDLYRRLRSAATYDELAEFRRELQDRFGPLPPAARRITELAELKLDAAIWQIKSIHVEGENVVFRYTGRPRAEQLARRQPGLRLVDETSLYLKAPQEVGDPAAILAAVKSVLRPD